MDPELKYSKVGPAFTGSLKAFFQNESLTTGCFDHVCLTAGMGIEVESIMSKAIFLLGAIEIDEKKRRMMRVHKKNEEEEDSDGRRVLKACKTKTSKSPIYTFSQKGISKSLSPEGMLKGVEHLTFFKFLTIQLLISMYAFKMKAEHTTDDCLY